MSKFSKSLSSFIALCIIFTSLSAIAADNKIILSNSMKGWAPVQDSVTVDTGQLNQGDTTQIFIIVQGSANKGYWNFARSPIVSLEPGKKYRLSCWVLLKELANPQYPPFLKCGVYKKGEWLANYFTPKYDMAKNGEWQYLSTEFKTPESRDLTGFVAVEKGTNKEAFNIVVYLSGLTFEQLD